MHTTGRLVLIAAWLFIGSIYSAEAQTNARTVIDRAIKAHGGAEKVARLKIARITVQGVTMESGSAVAITL